MQMVPATGDIIYFSLVEHSCLQRMTSIFTVFFLTFLRSFQFEFLLIFYFFLRNKEEKKYSFGTSSMLALSI